MTMAISTMIRPVLLRRLAAIPSSMSLSLSSSSSSSSSSLSSSTFSFSSSSLSSSTYSSASLPRILARVAAARPTSFEPQHVRASALHTTAKRDIIPPPPQHIEGGVNDAATVPPPSPTHGSYHWTFDRLLAAGLVPLTLAPFAAGSLNPTLDAAFCGVMLVHAHMGLQNIVIDYVPKKRFPTAFNLFMWGVRGVTVLAGVGLYEFETNDVGLTEAVRRIWRA